MIRKNILILLAFVTALLPVALQAQNDSVVSDSVGADTLQISRMSVEQIMDSPVSEVFFDEIADRVADRTDNHGFMNSGRNWVAIIAIVFVFGAPVIGVLIALMLTLRYLSNRNADRNRLVEMSLRTGTPLPPGFYGRPRRDTRINSGLIWISWGLGLMIFFLVDDDGELAALMSVPCFIGLSKLVVYFTQSRRKGCEDAEQD